MRLEKYSIGIGDRFAQQGQAQLEAVMRARRAGVDLVPVWNKSHREHVTIGTTPADVRAEADAAVGALGWTGSYYVDADHIHLDNVEEFLASSDFFTLDVTDFIGRDVDHRALDEFVRRHQRYLGQLEIPGIETSFAITQADVHQIARQFLAAAKQAGAIYRHIARAKGSDQFVVEVSIDETDRPQSPVELLFILAALAQENVPAQTIAPKFTGRFNKGVDYAGDVACFEQEFQQDLAVVALAVREFGMAGNLKLSVHSGSDKFALYEPIRRALRQFDAGVHLKTAGTTWLEELIGLAMGQGAGLELAKEIYRRAWQQFDELCAPYAAVIDIDRAKLPSPDTVDRWDGQGFAAALRHDPSCDSYDANLRQLLHIGYKVAANLGPRYRAALAHHEQTIAEQVTENLYERHIKPLFMA